jgi:hypothetical protein
MTAAESSLMLHSVRPSTLAKTPSATVVGAILSVVTACPDYDHDSNFFTSEQECRETLGVAPEQAVVSCMKSVLDSSAYTTKGSADVVMCYTEAISVRAS